MTAKFATKADRAQFISEALRAIRSGSDPKGELRAALAKLMPRRFGDPVARAVERARQRFLRRLQAGLSADVYAQVVAVIGDAADAVRDPTTSRSR